MADTVIIIHEPIEVIVIDDGETDEIIQEVNEVTQVIVEAVQGLPGAPGEDGIDGTGDLTYVHTQVGASTSWVVVHNLGKYPAVVVVDSGDTVVYGGITYDSINQVTLNFSAAFGGQAFFN